MLEYRETQKFQGVGLAFIRDKRHDQQDLRRFKLEERDARVG